MVSVVLSRTVIKDWAEKGFARGEGIGSGTPHELEVDPAALPQRADPRAGLCRMARFGLAKVRRAMERNGRSRMHRLNGTSTQQSATGGAPRRKVPGR